MPNPAMIRKPRHRPGNRPAAGVTTVPARSNVTDVELLALAAAMGVTRTPAEPVITAARHRPGPGRRVPGWLLHPRPARGRCWRPFARVGLVPGTATIAASLGLPLVWAVIAALAVALTGVLLAVGGVR